MGAELINKKRRGFLGASAQAHSEGATHIDMYDRPQFVAPAVAKLAAFFGRL